MRGNERIKRTCVDCGRTQDASEFYGFWGSQLCHTCRVRYDRCARCNQATPLEDMRQAYCVDCRRAYDRDRWARQREAREKAER
jgi:NMD protein affecting ribosome stability and mRNA decay